MGSNNLKCEKGRREFRKNEGMRRPYFDGSCRRLAIPSYVLSRSFYKFSWPKHPFILRACRPAWHGPPSGGPCYAKSIFFIMPNTAHDPSPRMLFLYCTLDRVQKWPPTFFLEYVWKNSRIFFKPMYYFFKSISLCNYKFINNNNKFFIKETINI